MIENFRQKVEETINFLPPLPSVVSELMVILNSDDYDLNKLARIISTDPSMTMNVLKIANSALFGLPHKVTTVEYAVNMLGIREIAHLCVSCGASRSLRPPRGVQTMDLQKFWKHSVATATIAKIVAQKFAFGRSDNLYLAGLIHDVGAVVLDRFKHDIYAEVLELTAKENISALEAEERIMGASHDTVGGWLMEKWQLSDVFIETASCHHHIAKASEQNQVLVAIVSLANILARLTMHGFDGNMSGEFIEDSEAFNILAERNPALKEVDMVKFVWDLDSANKEIEEVEGTING